MGPTAGADESSTAGADAARCARLAFAARLEAAGDLDQRAGEIRRLMFPTIILGLALLLLYKTIGMPVFPSLLLAHCVFGRPYCFRTVLASVQALYPALEEAGQSLGAGPLDTLFLVTLPLIWQGVLSGWLFAFIVSFGELNAALFLRGPGLTTLPIEIFSYLQLQGSQLVIAAASAVRIALIVLLVTGIERIVGMGRIIRSR